MALSARQLEVIRGSFDRLRADFTAPSEEFYAAMFRRAPNLRPLFREDLAGQGMKFMTTLAVIVDNLHDPGALQAKYLELGRLHAAVGVRRPDFAPLGEALMETLSSTLGAAFDTETEAAWRRAFAELSKAMIAGGDIRES